MGIVEETTKNFKKNFRKPLKTIVENVLLNHQRPPDGYLLYKCCNWWIPLKILIIQYLDYHTVAL